MKKPLKKAVYQFSVIEYIDAVLKKYNVFSLIYILNRFTM